MLEPFVALIRLANHTMMMLPVLAPDAQAAVHVASQLCVDNGQADALIVGLLNEADVSTVSDLMEKAKQKAQESLSDPDVIQD